MSRNNLIQFRKGTLAQFNSINPILASGEPGYAIDAAMLKVGNGITPWSGLPGFGTGSGISSLNNLTGPALLLVGGNNIGVTNSGTDIISISYTGVEHISISGIHDVNNSNNTFIQDLLFDQYGHVTGIASVAVTGIDSTPSNVDTIPTYTLGASSTNHYLFTGPGLTDDSPDPDIYVVRGKTHKFVNNMGAHPFQFQTTPGLGESAYTGGITGSPVSNGTLTWEVRHDTPQTLYYQCTSHANMQGTVHILGTGGAGGLTLGQLVGVSGYLQNQIFSNNTFVSGIVYNTGSRDLVLTRNDGVLLTGNLSSVLHSGDSISFLVNDVPYAISGSHIDISAATSVNESGRTYIQDILLDQYGHITGIATATETDVSHSKGLVNITNDTTTSVSISGGYRVGSLDIFLNGVKLILDNDFTAADGSGIVLSYSPESGSIIEFLSLPASQISSSHPTISAASNVNNSGQTFIKDIAFDQFGHVISVTSALASGGVSSDTNTFTNTLVYNTINREIVLSKNDGASLTGNLSVVLQSGDSIGLLNNDVGYITSFAETISSGDPVSFLVNDVPYAVSGSHISVSGAQHNYFYETNANNVFVNDLMFDSYGHVTGVILGTASGLGSSSSSSDIYLTGVVFDASRNLNFSWNGDVNSFSVNIPASGSSTHPTISAVSDVDNSNNVFVQDLLFDQYGHVTGIASVSVTGIPNVPNNILSSGDPISFLVNDIPYAISGSHIPKYVLTADGSSNYLFNGPGLSSSASDPTLYLYRGNTYQFVNNMGAHPFQFQTSLGGGAYTSGIIGSPVSNGTLTWEIRHDTPNILYYICTSHPAMNGVVYILDRHYHPTISAISNVDNSNNTFVQDLLFDSYGHVTGVVSAAATGVTSVGSTADIYLTGVVFNTSTRNLTFSWNSGVSDITVNIPSSGGGSSGGGGVLTSSGVNNILVASTGITIVHSTGTGKIDIGTTLNHAALSYFLH